MATLPSSILDRLAKRGISTSLVGDRVELDGRADVVTDELLTELRARRQQLGIEVTARAEDVFEALTNGWRSRYPKPSQYSKQLMRKYANKYPLTDPALIDEAWDRASDLALRFPWTYVRWQLFGQWS
ncbi:hypothetical protein FIL92_00535 [SAR202 cluster bacterium AD-812-D07_MRT_10900m]|nr:hypothetical protein [SAR202 cluster bacterium AD-812-D07_MRT_10900m]